MSYTRWSTSNWYSFYNSSSEDSTKDDQALSLWHVSDIPNTIAEACFTSTFPTIPSGKRDFTYTELKYFDENMLRTLYPKVNNDDINEALHIIELFIADVDDDFVDDLK